eukprot:6612408-Pyramimonas_sp.AAC.1
MKRLQVHSEGKMWDYVPLGTDLIVCTMGPRQSTPTDRTTIDAAAMSSLLQREVRRMLVIQLLEDKM